MVMINSYVMNLSPFQMLPLSAGVKASFAHKVLIIFGHYHFTILR